MSLKLKFVTIRSISLITLFGITLEHFSMAQDKPAAAPSKKETAGRGEATPDKTKAESKNSKEGAAGPQEGGDSRKPKGDASEKPEKTAYDYELPGSDGKGVPLNSFKGKTLLIVNLARNSSYNSQLAGLQKLSDTYKDKGLIVIGIPSNDFGAAEPGTDAEIQKAYKVDGKVTFLVMAKSALIGDAQLPFYLFLTKGKTVPAGGPVHWNYTKFIIDKAGKVVARFNPDVTPDSAELMSTLDQIIEGEYKPHKAGGEGTGEGGEPPS